MLARLALCIPVCLLSGTLLKAGAQAATPHASDSRCLLGVMRPSIQTLRAHLMHVPPAPGGRSGAAVVDIQIDENGKVCFASLRSADSRMSETAVDWVTTWRFSPFLLAGSPVQVAATIPVPFAQTPAANRESLGKSQDLCDKRNLCLYQKPDGSLWQDGEILDGTALRAAVHGSSGYILLRPDPRTPFATVTRTWAALRRETSLPVRLFAPYHTDSGDLVRLPGQFINRKAVIEAVRQMGYRVMRVGLGVVFPETGAKHLVGEFTVNLTGDARAARRLQSLTYQGPVGTPQRPWPEQWRYEFDVDGDGLVQFRAPEGDQPSTNLDKAVLRESGSVVTPAPYPAPARVLLRIDLAK